LKIKIKRLSGENNICFFSAIVICFYKRKKKMKKSYNKLALLVIIIIFYSCGLSNPFLETNLKDKLKAPQISRDGLIAEYLFNGNANDTSGNNLNGTLSGSPTLTADRTGSVNKAYNFDGIDDYITINENSLLNPSNAITVAAWYKPIASFPGIGYEPFVEKGFTSNSSPYYQYHLGVCGDTYSDPSQRGAFGFAISTGGMYNNLVTSPNFWSVGQQYFVVGTYDGSDLKLYVNGSFITSKPVTGNMTDYGCNVYIGKYQNHSNFLPGIVDNVRIYNRALSLSEIQILYNYDNL
jgi:hypothetical protein